ncbi:MAG: hypothetical protein KatS3mg103_0656 [Phycisphaerales bacterium]|nr:MAG: hypothetical protein KatS3mg103_0656 [Phycisphaerales bacterium]
MINDGLRVPVVVFMNELFDFVSALGDRTLSRVPGGGGPADGRGLSASPARRSPRMRWRPRLQDWMNEVERVQWICRLSPKLRALHGD